MAEQNHETGPPITLQIPAPLIESRAQNFTDLSLTFQILSVKEAPSSEVQQAIENAKREAWHDIGLVTLNENPQLYNESQT